MSLDAPILVESIARRLGSRPDRSLIVAYWYQVPGSRTAYADAVRATASDGWVIPLVVTDRFQNPNALMTDLRDLITDNRDALEGVPAPTSERPLVLVLLSKVELHQSQTTSPTTLLAWFPGLGGQTVVVWIEDLTWKADVPANAPDVRIDELRARLYDLDRAITRRIVQAAAANHNHVSGLLAEFKTKGAVKASDGGVGFLESATATIERVSNMNAYRLELKTPTTPLSGLVRLASGTPPDGLGAVAKQCSRALVLPAGLPVPRESLLATLACSTNRQKSVPPDEIFGWNMLLTAYAAHRFSTVSAHADDYPAYPASLLRSVSLELRTGLAGCTEFIITLPPVVGTG